MPVARPRCPSCQRSIPLRRRRADGSFPLYCEKPACRVRAFYARTHRSYKTQEQHEARVRAQRVKRASVVKLDPRPCRGRACGGKNFEPTNWRQHYCEVCRVIPWPKRRTRKRMRAA